MRGLRINACWVPHAFLFLIIFLSLLPRTRCVNGDDYSRTKNPAVLPMVTQLIYSRLTNITKTLSTDLKADMGFCIKNVDDDWNGAFNFTGKLGFLTDCIKQTSGDVTNRLCTAAEIRSYFKSFTAGGIKRSNYLKLNKNCNLTSWVSGCEPGWGCSLGQNQKVDLKASSIPSRTRDCQPCCAGFFCPEGITCMIPCPLGSFCPRAALNKTTGLCDPYSYQVPAGEPNHTCGGADIWADVDSKTDIFCSAGSYCPSPIRKYICSSGY